MVSSPADEEVEGSVRGYSILAYPSERRFVVDVLSLGRGKYMMHGLYEADVTRARQILRGTELSFTAFIVACVARAVARNKLVHGYLDWRGRLFVFDDIDVAVIVESATGDTTFPLAHVLRAANRRTVEELSDEIRAVQRSPKASPSGRRLWRFRGVYRWIPAFLRRLVCRALLFDPRWLKPTTGTVCVTSVGMFGGGGGFGIAVPTAYNFTVVVGGIAERPAFVDGEVVAREVVHLTLSFNHAIVDGAPAARASRDLRELIESASLLDNPLET